ncbi:MAG: sensor histidine kinase [Actinomycetota bacterium]
MVTRTRRIPAWTTDLALTALLTLASFIDLAQIEDDVIEALGYREPDPLAIALILLQTIPIMFRCRFPTTALAIGSVGFFVDRNLNYPSTIAIFGLLFIFHAVGAELPRRRAMITGWTTIVLMTAFTLSGVHAGYVTFGTVIVMFVFTSFPFILGLDSRRRQETEADLARRAQQLEFDRAEVLREERERIARELHDVVAHEMTVSTIQAAAAARLVGSDDEKAKRAAEEAERAGHEGLVELRRLLGVLRTDADASRTPQPGLSQLDTLIEQMGETGLEVTVDTNGEPISMPPGVDLNAYRIVQESLTNVLKHAGPGATASVLIGYRSDGIDITVTDNGRGAAASRNDDGQGHGLISMRERVSMLNGTFETGPRPGGGFRVTASLPCEAR